MSPAWPSASAAAATAWPPGPLSMPPLRTRGPASWKQSSPPWPPPVSPTCRLVSLLTRNPLCMGTSPDKLLLQNLPLAARVVLSAFLVSVGLGYFSALVQLHFVHASPGQLLPGAEEAKKAYGPGEKPQSHIERLLETPEGAKFNGTGTMRPAFTTKSEDWKKNIKKLDQPQRAALLAERDGERLA